MEQAAKRGIGGQTGNQGCLQYPGANVGFNPNADLQRMLAAEMNKKLAAHFGNSPDSIQARASGEAKSPAAVIQRQFSPELQGYPAQFQAPSGTVRFS